MAAVLDQQNTTTNVSQVLNGDTDTLRLGQSFVPSATGTLDSVIIKLMKDGSPTGTIALSLFADSGGVNPTGSALSTSSTVDVSTLTGTETEKTFTFSNDYTMILGTKYWIVAIPSYPTSGSNRARWSQQNSGNVYPAGNSNRYNGTSWLSDQGTNSMYFKEYYTPVTTGAAFLLNFI